MHIIIVTWTAMFIMNIFAIIQESLLSKEEQQESIKALERAADELGISTKWTLLSVLVVAFLAAPYIFFSEIITAFIKNKRQ